MVGAVEVVRHPDVGLPELLATPGVEEVCDLRSPFGLMAFHGGALEEMTDVIAREVAERTGASYYGVHQPPGTRVHVASTRFRPEHSPTLAAFLDHVRTVVTVHGFGRRGHFTSLLLGGRNRALADHVGAHLRERLPAYDVITDLDRIPAELRGMHHHNPVNRPAEAGVQLELPPRVRGSSPLWWDWEHGLTPHTRALVDGLVAAVSSWPTPARAD
jgi:phage replication-related protein YjqB (UPF0714/DUF867 family)